MRSRIPKNASGNGGGETARHNGELLIADDFLVARLGLGAMRLTGKGIWGEPADRNEAIRVVRRAAELGVNFFDTADSYGPYVDGRRIQHAESDGQRAMTPMFAGSSLRIGVDRTP